MTAQEIRERLLMKQVTFIPHHACGCCGEYTGWYLFGRWPPYEVAYSPCCGCGGGDYAIPDTWQSIADWVCDSNGELEEEYKWIKE